MAQKFGFFNSKKDAFDYFFIYEGKSVEEAEKLATTIANARGVPDIAETPKSSIDKVKSLIKQGNDLYQEYPKVGEFLVGLISGAATSLVGVAVGSKIEQNEEKPNYEIESINPKELGDEGSTV